MARLPGRIQPIIDQALSAPMSKAQQVDFVCVQAKVAKAKARRYLEIGRALLAGDRLDAEAERDQQIQRLQRAMLSALAEKKFSAYAQLEGLLAEVVGTKQPRRTEITGAGGGSVRIETWADLAKLGEAALKGEKPR